MSHSTPLPASSILDLLDASAPSKASQSTPAQPAPAAAPATQVLSTTKEEVIRHYLDGKSLRETAQLMGISFATVRQHLNDPRVKARLKARFNELEVAVADFKLKAVDAADAALEKLVNLSQTAKEESLQRQCSVDIVKISGLMPRKRVVVEKNTKHGIDDDTRDFFKHVLNEVKGEIVDAD